MKTSKNLIAGLALFSGLLAFATSASADWGHPRNDLHRDRQELSAARRELHNDIRRGAGRAEIAGDRAAISRERAGSLAGSTRVAKRSLAQLRQRTPLWLVEPPVN